jgi:DNA polymerase
MLAAMGVRLWAPAATPPATPPAEAVAAVPAVAEAPVPTAAAERPAEPLRAPAPAPEAARAPAPPPVRPPAPPPAPATPPAVRPATTIAAAAATLQETLSDPLLAERAATIATLAWGPLQDAVASCTACGLCASRRQTVFGVGHARAEWMIVGEAPGEQEDLAGEPFVGPAGQLLDQMLRAVGQSRRAASGEGREDDQAGDPAHRVYIANTLKCRPPRNRNPEPDEMARCEPFLKRQVALVRPKLILLMGRFAVRQLLKSDDAIGKLRGRVHHYEGIPVVVTYHPAYLLRNLPEKAKAWEDLCLARATADALTA